MAVPRSVTVPTVIGAMIGALAGWISLKNRGGIVLGNQVFDGLEGVLAMAIVLGLIGMALGFVLMLIMRTLQSAANPRDR
jgi:predicted lipid-binding transport protein (Tim44 family)